MPPGNRNRDAGGRSWSMRRTWTSAALAAQLSLMGACATEPQLQPTSGRQSAIGRRSLAVESRSGVTMTADGSVWDGSPENLMTEATPVWVTLRNTTGRPLRIQYDEFTLKGTSGASYVALAPYVMRASKTRPAFVVPDGGYFDKFSVAPYLAQNYPWLPVWNGPLPHGPSAESIAWRSSLPTGDMLDRALPEGVLEQRGAASGYLYFQKVSAREGEVTFLAELHEPTPPGQPANQLASIDIQFRRVTGRKPSTRSIYATARGPAWIP